MSPPQKSKDFGTFAVKVSGCGDRKKLKRTREAMIKKLTQLGPLLIT